MSRIAVDGRARAGQVIRATTNGLEKTWDLTVTVNAVDESKREIDLISKLPLGITVHKHIICRPLEGGDTQVSFG